MTSARKPAEDTASMAEVRAGVDALDREIIALFAERFAYMRAAARIKQDRGQVRDEARKQAVIDQATAEARALGIPADVIEQLWDQLVEASIAYELAEWDRTKG